MQAIVGKERKACDVARLERGNTRRHATSVVDRVIKRHLRWKYGAHLARWESLLWNHQHGDRCIWHRNETCRENSINARARHQAAEDCGGGIIWMPLFVIRCGEESIGQIVGEEIGAGAGKFINGSGCASERGAGEESANKGGGG